MVGMISADSWHVCAFGGVNSLQFFSIIISIQCMLLIINTTEYKMNSFMKIKWMEEEIWRTLDFAW